MTTLDENFLALGSCIAGIGILMAGLLALLFRQPNAPRWTRPEIVAMLLCVPVTATIGFGLAYTTYGLSHLVDGAGDPRELLVLAAVLIVLTLLWRGLRIRQRLKDYAAASNAASSGSPPEEPIRATDAEPPALPPAAGLPTKLA
jgi:heme A synthase